MSITTDQIADALAASPAADLVLRVRLSTKARLRCHGLFDVSPTWTVIEVVAPAGGFRWNVPVLRDAFAAIRADLAIPTADKVGGASFAIVDR